MLLHRDVRRGRQGTEDSGIWGPLDTVGPNLLTLTNGSFSPFGASLPAAQEQSLGRTLLTSGLQPMGPLWTRPGHGAAPAKRLQSQRGETGKSTSRWAAPQDQAGQARRPLFSTRRTSH